MRAAVRKEKNKEKKLPVRTAAAAATAPLTGARAGAGAVVKTLLIAVHSLRLSPHTSDSYIGQKTDV